MFGWIIGFEDWKWPIWGKCLVTLCILNCPNWASGEPTKDCNQTLAHYITTSHDAISVTYWHTMKGFGHFIKTIALDDLTATENLTNMGTPIILFKLLKVNKTYSLLTEENSIAIAWTINKLPFQTANSFLQDDNWLWMNNSISMRGWGIKQT